MYKCLSLLFVYFRLHLQQQVGSSESVCGSRAGVSPRGGLSQRLVCRFHHRWQAMTNFPLFIFGVTA